MLTLPRTQKEPKTGLMHWLASEKPVERQYAAESLAEMGDIHGTDFLILLASTEDRRRRKSFRCQSILLSGIGITAVSLGILTGFHGVIPVVLFGTSFLYERKVKTSPLQQTAIEKLAEGRSSAALGTLVDALWRTKPSLRYSAVQGLIRLLPLADKKTFLSTPQWNCLLQQIWPSGRFERRQPNKDLIIAILKGVAAAEYFPAIDRVYRLSLAPIGPWGDSAIRSAASDCYSQLITRQQQRQLSSLVEQQ
jgi:hypothetical protein